MNRVNVNNHLLGNMLLYPMQGFYLLHVPLAQEFSRFTKSLLGESI